MSDPTADKPSQAEGDIGDDDITAAEQDGGDGDDAGDDDIDDGAT